MAGRKVGVGFNHVRVVGGVMQCGYRNRWRLMRALVRLRRNPQGWIDRPMAASAVDASRKYLADN